MVTRSLNNAGSLISLVLQPDVVRNNQCKFNRARKSGILLLVFEKSAKKYEILFSIKDVTTEDFGKSLSRCWLVVPSISWLAAGCCGRSGEARDDTSPPSSALLSRGVSSWAPGRAAGPAAAEDSAYPGPPCWRWSTVWPWWSDTPPPGGDFSQCRHSGRSDSQHCPPSRPCSSCGRHWPQLTGPAGRLLTLTGISSQGKHKAGTASQQSRYSIYSLCSEPDISKRAHNFL